MCWVTTSIASDNRYMPTDPEVVAIVQDLLETQSLTLNNVLTALLPQLGVIGALVLAVVKRVRKAEENLEAIRRSCVQLLKLHEDDDSNLEIAKILEKLIHRDRGQHAHNRWTQEALKLIVKRVSQASRRDVEADSLELSQPPSSGREDEIDQG